MRGKFRLDDKLLIVAFISLAIAIVSMSLSFFDIVQMDLMYLFTLAFAIYLVTFFLFLYYNHELSKEEHEKRKAKIDTENPYKITFLFGLFLFLTGLIGNLIESNFILMALTSGGLLAIVYSAAGWHDLKKKGS
ncbi:MAG: hypothetical protein ACOC1V_03285 [Candidatus Saliniplasma sp.]